MKLDVLLNGVKVAEVDEYDWERKRALMKDKALVFVPHGAGKRAAEAAEKITQAKK